MTAIGETLRRERLRRNMDLETISRELKISAKFLEAIEDEKFERLPGGVFAKSFVRQYAHVLGLDEEEMANEVQRQTQPADAPQFVQNVQNVTPSTQPIVLPKVEEWDSVGESRFHISSSLTALALVVVVMMGCAGVYSWWQRTRHTVSVSAHDKAPSVAAPVAKQAAAETVPPTPAPVPDQSVANRAAAPAPATANADAPTTAPPVQPAAAPETSPAAATPLAGTNTPPNPNATVHVELTAVEAAWVSVKADGKYVFSGTIEANQSRTVEATSTVLLRLGNAGGVNVTLNGKPIGTVGPKGQVRTIQLTSGGFEIVAAPKPPSAPLDPLR
jgi:cytoskeleton protein RodZ